MKIGELAKRSGLTAYTIRYYERIGLLPYAHRDQSNQRDYDASILVWIEFLARMKTTGMPIRTMLKYAALRKRGTETEVERHQLLEQHRETVRAHMVELNDCLLVLDTKITGYIDREKRMKNDDNKPKTKRKPISTRSSRSGAD